MKHQAYHHTRTALFSLCLTAALLVSCAAPKAQASSQPASASLASAQSSVAESASTPAAARTTVRIGSLKGATTMGLVKLMADADSGTARHDYAVTMAGTADEITPLLVQGQLDVALLPANLASVLYNKTQGAVQVAAINSLGVLSMVSTDASIQSVASLKGKTILTAGKGTVPEYVLNYILEQNGLTPGTDVTVRFYSEATEVAAMLAEQNTDAVAMLPQPYVTALQAQKPELATVLDMTAEWEKVSPQSGLVTGVVVVRKGFAQENPAVFAEFLQDYADSAAFINEHLDEGAAMVVARGIVPKEPLAKKAIPACHIVSITGAQMKANVMDYLSVLYAQNPQAVGGALPGDDFYYGA